MEKQRCLHHGSPSRKTQARAAGRMRGARHVIAAGEGDSSHCPSQEGNEDMGQSSEFSPSQQCSRLPPPLLHRHHHSHTQQALPWAHLSIHPPGPPPQPQDPSWDPAQPQKEDGVKQRAHPCSAGTKGVCMPCPASGEAQTAPRHRAPPRLQHL